MGNNNRGGTTGITRTVEVKEEPKEKVNHPVPTDKWRYSESYFTRENLSIKLISSYSCLKQRLNSCAH